WLCDPALSGPVEPHQRRHGFSWFRHRNVAASVAPWMPAPRVVGHGDAVTERRTLGSGLAQAGALGPDRAAGGRPYVLCFTHRLQSGCQQPEHQLDSASASVVAEPAGTA